MKRHKRTASICIYTRRDLATPSGNDRCHFLGGATLPRIIENTLFCFAFDDLIILAAPPNQPNTGTHLTTNRLKTGLFAMLHRSSWCFCARENVHRSEHLVTSIQKRRPTNICFSNSARNEHDTGNFFLTQESSHQDGVDEKKLTPRQS